jgi:hypothetical protein
MAIGVLHARIQILSIARDVILAATTTSQKTGLLNHNVLLIAVM